MVVINLQISARSLLTFILEMVTESYFENCLGVIFRAVRVRSHQRKKEGKCGFKEQTGFSKHPILRFFFNFITWDPHVGAEFSKSRPQFFAGES